LLAPYADYLNRIDDQIEAAAAMAQRNPELAQSFEKMALFFFGLLERIDAEHDETAKRSA
jgi:hypothetical protein